MKDDQEADDRQELLDAVLADDAPGIDAVLTGVRRARRARSARRVLLCAATAVCFLLSMERDADPIVAVREVPAVVTVVEPSPATEESLRVERLNDQELLEMLEGMPVALASYPDGKQALMVIAK